MLEQTATLKSTQLKLLSESDQIIAAKFSGCTIGSYGGYESASCTLALPIKIATPKNYQLYGNLTYIVVCSYAYMCLHMCIRDGLGMCGCC